MEIVIPNELKIEYPFKSQFFDIDTKNKIHYLDEGQGEIIIMVHGNPTWSFFYRNLIKSMSLKYRIICPDHMGCGLSSRDENYNYTLKNHIDNIDRLIEKLKIQNFSLIVHDWGGAIGMGLATRYPERVKKIVAMNTAAFTSLEIPFRINILRNSLGEQIIRRFNAFAGPATFMAVDHPLSPIVKKGFLLPYNNYKNRIATAKFVRDIPLNKKHQTYSTLKMIEDNLNKIKSPVLLLWGENDFCFTMNFYKRWLDFFPKAKHISYPQAGHYVIEDEFENINKEINLFFEKT